MSLDSGRPICDYNPIIKAILLLGSALEDLDRGELRAAKIKIMAAIQAIWAISGLEDR